MLVFSLDSLAYVHSESVEHAYVLVFQVGYLKDLVFQMPLEFVYFGVQQVVVLEFVVQFRILMIMTARMHVLIVDSGRGRMSGQCFV